jgi:integrase
MRKRTHRGPPAEGVYLRHQQRCPSRRGEDCRCRPTYQAQVWSARDNKPIRKTFPTLAAAKAWRSDAQSATRQGRLRAPTKTTITEAADQLIAGMKTGSIRTRSGHPYKPSVVRSYDAALRLQILPEFGARRLDSLTQLELQDWADERLAAGADPSTVRNHLMPLRVIYRRAVTRGQVGVNPTLGLELPTPQGRRERVATPAEAKALLDALEPGDRALWATALYAGLRRGELRALDWEDVDLKGRAIHVRRSWDRRAGAIEPKTRAAVRSVPVPDSLQTILLRHYLLHGRARDGYVFTSRAGAPFDPSTVLDRARKAWKAAGLEAIGLHECRHTYASLLLAAGVNPKAVSAYLGHASITITVDRYGHLMPGNEADTSARLDGYLAR